MKLYDELAYDGIGYLKLMHYNSWRIAILNYIDELRVENIHAFQAHLLTDEAFVLLEGNCTIFLLNGEVVEAIELEKHKVYNIHSGVYHSHSLSEDCKLLIIEEENTADSNSPSYLLNENQKKNLRTLVGKWHV